MTEGGGKIKQCLLLLNILNYFHLLGPELRRLKYQQSEITSNSDRNISGDCKMRFYFVIIVIFRIFTHFYVCIVFKENLFIKMNVSPSVSEIHLFIYGFAFL